MLKYRFLKSFLENQGLKQKFLAKKIGVTESVLSEILNGKRKYSLDLYAKICVELNVDFGMFIDSNKDCKNKIKTA